MDPFFSRIYANENLKRTLIAMNDNGRFPHALVLEGPKGSGKHTMAKAVAALLFCEGEQKPCGICPHCRKLLHDSHPDLSWEEREKDKQSFSVGRVRQIREKAFYKPNEAKGKVMVICEAERLNTQAQNALLKILEEPPEATTFILLTEDRNRLLPTIRSRVQTFPMEMLPESVMRQALEELRPQKAELFDQAIRRANGVLGVALDALEKGKKWNPQTVADRYLTAYAEGNRVEMLHVFAEIEKKRENVREVLVALRRELGEEATHPAGRIPWATGLQLLGMVDIIDETIQSTDKNANLPLTTTRLTSRLLQVSAGSSDRARRQL